VVAAAASWGGGVSEALPSNTKRIRFDDAIMSAFRLSSIFAFSAGDSDWT
jgi:hypothetical protein